jgi:hypothetical protein
MIGYTEVVSANPNQPPPFSWGGDKVKAVFVGDGHPIAKTVNGRKCIESADTKANRYLYFDVDDDYVFDGEVDALIEIEYDSTASGRIHLDYDSTLLKEKHKGAFLYHDKDIQPDKSTRWARHVFKLSKARFANRQHGLADFRFISPDKKLRISDIKVSVQKGAAAPDKKGVLKLRVLDDATGKITPARVGIYDERGRFKPPAKDSDAVPINVFYRTLNMFNCRGDTTWPIGNTYAFWIYGQYECELPAGRYQLIVRKGIEYYLVNQWLTVEAGKILEHTVRLKRWIDMSAKGWYSGDAHVHIGRTREQNPAVMAQCEGEDLNVSNLSQMGNIETYYFKQYAFGEEGKYRRGKYVLVPSQEEPRTPHRGHSLLLNMERMVRDDETYYLYHKAYQEIRDQGGLVGYAHMGLGFSAERGMALDVPFGLIDFVEMLQVNNINDRVYYQFLNLGYRLVPTAGSDYPYCDPPGLVRNYVHLDGPYSDQAWFDALAGGRTFMTTGPILTFNVNCTPMGGELRVNKGDVIDIRATAVINPTMGKLKQIQLIVHGDKVATANLPEGEKSLKFSHKMSADRSMWMAVKVICQGKLLAHTAPIYVVVDGQRTWKKSAVPVIVAKQRQRLKDLVEKPVKSIYETWLDDTLKTKWARQQALIEKRTKLANAKYDELLKMLDSK